MLKACLAVRTRNTRNVSLYCTPLGACQLFPGLRCASGPKYILFLLINFFFVVFAFFCVPRYISTVHHFGDFCLYDCLGFYFISPTIEVVTFRLLWVVRAGFVVVVVVVCFCFRHSFVLDINVRIVEFEQWNTCEHRLDLSLCSHPIEF